MTDPLYIRARATLIDAAEALYPHRDALVLVGAQAIYLHTGDTDLAVPEYTTDADFTVAPADLADAPLLADLLSARGFTPREHPGGWLSPDGIYLDIMVPEKLAGPRTRGARLGSHGKRAARLAKGLEGALIDRERLTISALDPNDDRTVELWVAGPGALLVAKVHKIAERVPTKTASATKTRSTSSDFSAASRPISDCTSLRAGVPIKVVSERLGHSTPGFTMATYQHVIPGMQEEAAQTFAGILEASADCVRRWALTNPLTKAWTL